MQVKELTKTEEFEQAFPVMAELCDHLTVDDYLRLLDEMRQEGYRMFALMVGEEMISVAGVAIRTDFFNGKHLWIHDFVTRSDIRSKGSGSALAGQLEKFATDEGCEKIVLYSGLSREQAHHFWETKAGFERRGIVFKKQL